MSSEVNEILRYMYISKELYRKIVKCLNTRLCQVSKTELIENKTGDKCVCTRARHMHESLVLGLFFFVRHCLSYTIQHVSEPKLRTILATIHSCLLLT